MSCIYNTTSCAVEANNLYSQIESKVREFNNQIENLLSGNEMFESNRESSPDFLTRAINNVNATFIVAEDYFTYLDWKQRHAKLSPISKIVSDLFWELYYERPERAACTKIESTQWFILFSRLRDLYDSIENHI